MGLTGRRTSASLGLAGLAMMAAGVAAAQTRPAQSEAANVATLTMRTPRAGFNRMVVTITVCAPGTDRCATIGDVMVDTGSTGLRLEASAVPPWLDLPAFLGPGGKPLAECLHFVHDDAWGPLHRADLHIGGLTAADLPLQIIADGDGPQPASCPHLDVRPTSNGTLGIGPNLDDCWGGCEQSVSHPGVYVCEAEGCVPIDGRVPPVFRLPNPVSRFPEHDNGIVVDLPAAPPGGAREVVGTLTFGVGTAGNNALGPARILRLDGAGHFTTLFSAATYPDSFIDSGTETTILDDAELPRCAGMEWAYCVAPERSLQAVMVGADGAHLATPFRVGDYRAIRDSSVGASDAVAVAAAPGSTAFVWGAPFFLGRRVFVVMEGRAVPGHPGVRGPFYAIVPRLSTGP